MMCDPVTQKEQTAHSKPVGRPVYFLGLTKRWSLYVWRCKLQKSLKKFSYSTSGFGKKS